MLNFYLSKCKIRKAVRGDEKMYLVKINREQELYGGIIVDVQTIAKMYKSESLDRTCLKNVLRKVNRSEVKQMEDKFKYAMKTVNVYSDRGDRRCDIRINDIKNDINMKIKYELSYREDTPLSDRYTLDITGFEIEPSFVKKTEELNCSKSSKV